MIDEKKLIELLENEILRIDTESTPSCGNLYGKDASIMKNTLNHVIDLINEQAKEKVKVSNLEFYKDEILRKIEILKKQYSQTMNNGEIYAMAIAHVYMQDQNLSICEINYETVSNWLLAEHKEPIKLTQAEKDLLKSFADVDEGWNGRVLNECYIIRNMRHKGYFKNVDLSMTFREVLGNCEVVE